MFHHVLRRQARHVGGHLVDGESDVVEGSLLLVVGDVGLVLLGHAHHHVALGRPAPRDLDVELGVLSRGLCKARVNIDFDPS